MIKTFARDRTTRKPADTQRQPLPLQENPSPDHDHDDNLGSTKNILTLQRLQGNTAVQQMLAQPSRAIQRDEDEETLTIQAEASERTDEKDADTLVQRAPTENEDDKKDGDSYLEKVWPIGLGIRFEGDIGITPAIPLYLSGGGFVELVRANKDTIKILVRQTGTIAGDTGVGASAGLYSRKTGKGVGAGAGVNAQVGVKAVSMTEYQVPFSQVYQFLMEWSRKKAMAQLYVDNSFSDYLFKKMGWKTLDSYESSSKYEIIGFAQGDASAMLGLQTGNANRAAGGTDVSENWYTDSAKIERDGERPSVGAASFLQSLFSLSASLKLGGEIKGGVSTKPPVKTEKGQQQEVTFTLEGSQVFDLQLPLFNLAALPLGNKGVGANVKMIVSTDAEGNASLGSVSVELYTKSGELDYYAGAGSQNTIRLNNVSVKTFDDLLALLTPGKRASASLSDIASNAEIEVRQRYDLTAASGRLFKAFMTNRSGVRVMNLDNKGVFDKFGVEFGIYLTATFGLNAAKVLEMWELIKPEAKKALQAAGDSQSVAEVYKALTDFTTNFSASPIYAKLEKIVFDNVYVNEGMYRVLVEGGIGGQVAVSEGLKARLDGYLKLGGFYERDFAGGQRITLSEFFKRAANEYNAMMQWLNDLLARLDAESSQPGANPNGQPGQQNGAGIGNGKQPVGKDGKQNGSGNGSQNGQQPQQIAIEEIEVTPANSAEKMPKNPTGLSVDYYFRKGKVWGRLAVVQNEGGKQTRYSSWVQFTTVRTVGDKVYINLPNAMVITPPQAKSQHTIFPWAAATPVNKKFIKGYPAVK